MMLWQIVENNTTERDERAQNSSRYVLISNELSNKYDISKVLVIIT